MRNNFGKVFLTVLIFYIGFLFGNRKLQWSFRNYKPSIVLNKEVPASTNADFSMFWVVWDKLSREYVDKKVLDAPKMVQGAISGMVSALGDPYTVYLPPVLNKEAKADLAGEFEGVGIQLGYKNDILTVIAPLPGTPAEKAGVLAGDLILHIKDDQKKIDQSTDKLAISQAVAMIRGPKNSTIQLTLGREGAKEPIKVDLIRETIINKSVKLKIIEKDNKKIVHLNLYQFGDRTEAEWQEAISQIGSLPIVLDLRNNPGGYLEGAVYIASEFLPSGKTVVTQADGVGNKDDLKVNRNGRLLKNKMVVLVNEGSASAAEILSGALQDYQRAKIVGVKSFGKGSVQMPQDFADGSGIHITVARWLRPSGEWIDKIGIIPDVEVIAEKSDPDMDIQLQKALDIL
ncbi:MAG: S41 family peptidase [Patescibacteria group bacterium]